MKNTIEAVVAGHICLDLTPKFGQSTEETGSTISLTDILAPGKIIQMDGIELSTGGAVANTDRYSAFFDGDRREPYGPHRQ